MKQWRRYAVAEIIAADIDLVIISYLYSVEIDEACLSKISKEILTPERFFARQSRWNQ